MLLHIKSPPKRGEKNDHLVAVGVTQSESNHSSVISVAPAAGCMFGTANELWSGSQTWLSVATATVSFNSDFKPKTQTNCSHQNLVVKEKEKKM